MTQQERAGKAEIWLLGLIYLAAIVSFVVSGLLLLGGHIQAGAIAGGICLIIILLAVGLSCCLILSRIQKVHHNTTVVVSNLQGIRAGQTKSEAILTNISENQLLSDAMKSIAFRRNDKTVLEGAIQQDIRTEHWDSAEKLIDELESQFGCKTEAEKWREELSGIKNATKQEKIEAAVKHVESLLKLHHYKEAQQQEDELLKIYPDNEKVNALKGRTEANRLEHKKDLLSRLDKANKNNDLDQGVEILKLLDNYLTPTEAAALEESARDVFRARLHNMGVQFSLFVTEQAWHKALKLGKEIIREYPNSRMAEEVRQKIDTLKQRAGL